LKNEPHQLLHRDERQNEANQLASPLHIVLLRVNVAHRVSLRLRNHRSRVEVH
jgi:hypothetical protein